MDTLFVMPPLIVVGLLALVVSVLGLAVRWGLERYNAALEAQIDQTCEEIRAAVDPTGSHMAARVFNSALPEAIDRVRRPPLQTQVFDAA